MNGMTVAALLARARALGVDRLDAQLLLVDTLRRPRAWLIAHDTDALDPGVADEAQAAIARRAAGEPLAYIVGRREFHGLELRVSPAVLVPRPDTETLVDWVLERVRPGDRVLDLGTGSGAIALAVKRAAPLADVTALDASAEALAVARDNAARLGLDVAFVESDWFAALGGRRFEWLLSNPPYIAEGDAHLPALRHEPASALTSGADGLDAIRHLVRQAPGHLAPGGRLLLEHGFDQAEAVRSLLLDAGFADVHTREDIERRPRCTGGRWHEKAAP